MKFTKILSRMSLLMVAVLFLSVFSISEAYSQRDDKPRKSPEEMATRMADKMKTNLSLSDAQHSSVRSILLTHFTEMKQNKDSWKSLSREEKKSKMMQSRENLKNKLASVLTPDQIKKHEENRKNFKHEGKGKRNKTKREG